MIFMNSRNTLVAAIIIFGGITLTIIITQTLISQLTDYIDWFQENRVEGSIVFLTLYLLFGLFALPASFHKYLAGVIFGFIPGVLIAWIGSMLGAIFPFIAGKKWANPYAQRTLERNPQLVGLQDYMIDNGKKTVALTRVSLVIPYGVLNYSYGATDINFRDYIIGNFAMIIPAIMYAWWGSQTVIIGGVLKSEEKNSFDILIIIASILITIAMIAKGKKIIDDISRSD